MKRRAPNIAHVPNARLRSGFTLVEILLVVAISGVLAALLWPVLAGARESARTAQCSGNLRQIHLALRLYVSDNNRRYPPGGYPQGREGCSWADLMMPYARQKQIFECPTAEYGEFQPGCPPDVAAPGDETITVRFDGSYGLNWLSLDGFDSISEVRVRRPAATILVMDGDAPFGSFLSTRTLGVGGKPLPIADEDDLARMGVEVPGRHRDGNNALFADGHIKWMAIDSLFDETLWRIDK